MDKNYSVDDNSKENMKKISSCDVEALKKCLEENKGDSMKCQTHIEAFKSACTLKKSPSPVPSPSKNI